MSINIILLISIGVVSYISFSNRELFHNLLFSPYRVSRDKEWHRFLSSAWVHGDMMHLFFNMFVLFSFGNLLESIFTSWFSNFGIGYYILLFVLSVIIAHLPTYLKEKDNYAYSSVGASGGVSGVLFACILIDPAMELKLFLSIPMNSLVFGILYIGYTIYMSRKGQDNINHEAHLWGAIAGIAVTIVYRPSVVLEFVDSLLGMLPV